MSRSAVFPIPFCSISDPYWCKRLYNILPCYYYLHALVPSMISLIVHCVFGLFFISFFYIRFICLWSIVDCVEWSSHLMFVHCSLSLSRCSVWVLTTVETNGHNVKNNSIMMITTISHRAPCRYADDVLNNIYVRCVWVSVCVRHVI